MSSNFYRGVDVGSDFRHHDRSKETRRGLLAAAPPEFGVRVSMSKVYRPVLEGWVSTRVTELLGFEDDIVVGLVTAALQEEVRST